MKREEELSIMRFLRESLRIYVILKKSRVETTRRDSAAEMKEEAAGRICCYFRKLFLRRLDSLSRA